MKERLAASVREAINGKDSWLAYVKAGKPKGWPNFRKHVRQAKAKLAPVPAQEQPAASGRKRRAGGAEAAEAAGEAAAAAAGGEAPEPPAKGRRKATKLIRYTSRRKCCHEKTRAKRVCLQNAHVRLWTPELETFGPTPESNRARTPTGHMHAV